MMTRDATSAATPINAPTLTWAHTCSGAKLVLFVFSYDPAGLVTGVTYNGVAMTQVTSQTFNGSEQHKGWLLLNPATGTNNIVITRSGAAGFQLAGTASSYNATKAVQPDSFNSATNSGFANITTATTVIASGCWLIASGYWTGIGNAHLVDSLDTNSFLLQQGNYNTKQTGYVLADTNGTVGTGSQSVEVHQVTASGGPVVFAEIVISIAPIPDFNPLFMFSD